MGVSPSIVVGQQGMGSEHYRHSMRGIMNDLARLKIWPHSHRMLESNCMEARLMVAATMHT
jgi:hypothetical protein